MQLAGLGSATPHEKVREGKSNHLELLSSSTFQIDKLQRTVKQRDVKHCDRIPDISGPWCGLGVDGNNWRYSIRKVKSFIFLREKIRCSDIYHIHMLPFGDILCTDVEFVTIVTRLAVLKEG